MAARESLLDRATRPGSAGAELPVRPALSEVIEAVRARRSALLIAPPGSGKTSLLPLALADAVEGRVIVAEPRRIATRAAARRMAELIGESTGRQIGYSMRGESRTSPSTRVEVVTTGVLVQRLQRDPELAGVGAVVIDECHERHLDSDLALAFCLDIQANLRADLLLVATSATPDSDRIAAVLGEPGRPAPTVTAIAFMYPVEIIWAPPARPLPLLADARVDPRLLEHVADTVRRALGERAGDVLVFLPGEGEINAVVRRLSGVSADVVPLYGRQSAAEQDRALAGGTGRRVVLSTAVAESSLTVPGVQIVIDAGLAREPRTDFTRGLTALTTTKVARSSAEQRAGRAGREAPGRVYRCWSEAEHAHLQAHPAPEISTTDLTSFALATARWGQPGGQGLALLDPPPTVALAAAESALLALGATDADGRITERGRAIAQIPAHPRLARALLDGAQYAGAARAREIVALLSDDSFTRAGDDLPANWRRLRNGTDAATTARWREEIRRLETAAPATGGSNRGPDDDLAAGLVVGLAYPERLARVRGPDRSDYLMAGGTGAALGANSTLRGTEWLAVAVADRPSGRADARIRLAAPIDEAAARRLAGPLLTTEDQIGWVDGDLRLRQQELLGAIVLTQRPLRNPDPILVAAAVSDGLRSEGLGLLHWTDDAEQLRQRMSLCHRVLGPPWPLMSDQALLSELDSWLGPDLARVRRRADLGRIQAGPALRRLLPWPAAARFEQLVPERLEVPSGSRVRLTYSDDAPPVLAVRVQEAFGWLDTPTVADGRVPVVLHLLSPAGRPVAITGDLASFWRQGYPQVRADLRGRYPRHPWPEDPLNEPPTRRVRPRN
ncbi:MAG: ATP-dependent helicase HrpB [Pseudonocardiales bacterium]|nr:ATP-dependent helicase HrpB [Pseudonocardiales bacterium]